LRADGIALPRGNDGEPKMSATLSTIVRPSVGTRPAGAILRLLRSWARDVPRYFVRRADTKRLAELSDRELRDIGLTRSQIEAAVHGFMPRPDWTRM
jgi:uncharacterized protein YjiS (DUF1127 family)